MVGNPSTVNRSPGPIFGLALIEEIGCKQRGQGRGGALMGQRGENGYNRASERQMGSERVS